MPAVSFSLLGGAGWQFLDDNGDPLSGGLVYTYQAGGTTPAATYTTSSGSTANPNPIELDAAGRPPEEIWLLSGQNYKFQLNESDDTPIRTYDNVPAADAGITTLLADLASTASGEGAGLIGFSQSATYSASTVGRKLQQSVSVDDHPYSAAGNGTTDDTAAIQAAFATGKTVEFTGGKTYKVTDTIDYSADGQKVFLNGATILAVGNFNLFSISGLEGCGLYQGVLDGTDQTGGYLIYLSDVERTFISDLQVHNPYNYMYAEKFNALFQNNVWVNNVRGDYGCHFYGETDLRSDAAFFINVTISCHTTPKVAIGLLVDGYVHTVTMQVVKLLNFKNGLQYKNTSGGPVPMFLFADTVEIEFSLDDGVDLQVGEHFYFTNLYSVSSENGAGVKVGAAVPHRRMSITNGDIVDNATYGVDNPSTAIQVSGLSMYDNVLGDFSGDAILNAPIVEPGANFFLKLLAGNPIINFDDTDYLEYQRASNRLALRIGGTDHLVVNTTGVEVLIGAAMQLIQAGAADSGGTGYRMLRVPN